MNVPSTALKGGDEPCQGETGFLSPLNINFMGTLDNFRNESVHRLNSFADDQPGNATTHLLCRANTGHSSAPRAGRRLYVFSHTETSG